MKEIMRVIKNKPELQKIFNDIGASVVLIATAQYIENSMNKFNLTNEEKESVRLSYLNDLKAEFKRLNLKNNK